MRYHPNILKLCFLIWFIKNFIASKDMMNATAIPSSIMDISVPVKEKPNFNIFKALKPNITGTARKKVNSAAVTLDTPISKAPIIVAPEREVPGIIDNT